MTRSVLPNAELRRAVQAMTVGAQDDTTRRRNMLEPDTAKERDQQLQMAISGVAGSIASWSSDIAVTFDTYFHCAPGNRASNLIYPHFTHGAVITTGDPVVVHAVVTEWTRDGNLTTTGCKFKWCAFAPDQPDIPYNFAGMLHLHWQGYGAPPDVDNSQLEDDLGTLGGAPDPVTSGDDS